MSGSVTSMSSLPPVDVGVASWPMRWYRLVSAVILTSVTHTAGTRSGSLRTCWPLWACWHPLGLLDPAVPVRPLAKRSHSSFSPVTVSTWPTPLASPGVSGTSLMLLPEQITSSGCVVPRCRSWSYSGSVSPPPLPAGPCGPCLTTGRPCHPSDPCRRGVPLDRAVPVRPADPSGPYRALLGLLDAWWACWACRACWRPRCRPEMMPQTPAMEVRCLGTKLNLFLNNTSHLIAGIDCPGRVLYCRHIRWVGQRCLQSET